MVATGGTIASMPAEDGLTPALTGEELARFVPEAADLCDLDVVQPMNVDSTNMRPQDWLVIAREIRRAYDAYDGFVVLHGTDTMGYTAAALSYLIQGSPKPIVLTGSQRPMADPFTDGKINLYDALLYVTSPGSRDVSVVFGGSVIAGTRAHKQRTMSFDAFESVNFPRIAVVRNRRVIQHGGAGMPGATDASEAAGASRDEPRWYDRVDADVIALKLTPGLSPEILGMLRDRYRAVVLETFGIGGIPEYHDASWRRAIFDWLDAGRALVVTTQVAEEGLDLGIYEVGRAYSEHPGVLKGDDMTLEALVAKTMWALGQTHDADELRDLFYRPVNFDRLGA